MADFFDDLNEELIEFIKEQKIFFVATAANQGLINLSPKGMDTFTCIDNNTVGYLDLTGSGNETAAHIKENKRLTIMMCSFTQKPLILRLYGEGEVIFPRNKEWDKWKAHFNTYYGERQIILLHIKMVQTACGYAVPFYEYKKERDTLTKWTEKLTDSEIKEYWKEKNQLSLDKLPTGLLDNN